MSIADSAGLVASLALVAPVGVVAVPLVKVSAFPSARTEPNRRNHAHR